MVLSTTTSLNFDPHPNKKTQVSQFNVGLTKYKRK